MTKKYTSPEHAIRDIIEGKGKERIPGSKELGTDLADKIRDFFGIEVPTSKGELVPVTPATPPAARTETPPSETPATTLPATRTDTEAPPATRTDTAPATRTDTAPAVRTDTAPATRTDTAPAVRTDTAPAVRTDTAPAVRTDTAPAVRTDTQTRVRNPEPPPPRVRTPETPPRVRTPQFGGGLTPGQPIGVGAGGTFDVPSYLHMATDRRVFEENDADKARRKIVSVPRPDSKREETMTRNQEIKQKIVEETGKKKAIIKDAVKEYSVKMKPELKTDLQERRGFGSTAAATTGAGLGVTQGQNIEKGLQDAGVQNPDSQRTWFDTALDVASMIPVVGAVPSAVSAYRSLQRGDYLDAALDAAGAIPGLGIFTKGLKLGGKAAKGAGLMSNVTRVGDVTQRVGGKTVIPPTVSSSSTLGRAIDNTSNAAEAIATPGNLFQLGQAAEPVVKPVASAVQDVYNQKVANNKPTATSSNTSPPLTQ